MRTIHRKAENLLFQIEISGAEAQKDIDFIENVLADEYFATYDDGSIGDKAKELKLARDFNQQIESSSVDEFTLKIYGDMAIVWFSRHLAGPRQGKRVEVHFWFTDVFVMRAGRWQCVSSQSTKLPEQTGQR